MSSDPNELEKAEAAKLTAHQHATALRSATVAVTTALRPFRDVDRKRVLDEALTEFNSGLAVRQGGS
jgi:hypothetical protein